MFDKHLLKDKVILITGGGSGLGLAMAERFAELSAKTVICGRKLDKLEQASKIIKLKGLEPELLTLDVRDEEQVTKLFEQTSKKFGKIDILVNNAAGNFYCPAEDLTSNAFNSVIDIVLKGSFFCSRAFGQLAIKNNTKGSILNIVTTYSSRGSAFVLPSACAKAGVESMTKSLAFEWADYNIRVNAIAPGPIPTDGAWARLMPDPLLEKKYKDSLPLKRFGSKEELANLASFIVSDQMSYLTGEIVTFDGAESLKGTPFNFLTDFDTRDNLRQIFRAMKPKK